MAQNFDAKKLDSGDAFPPLKVNLLDGGSLNLPEDLAGHWSVVLFFRGHW
jgi:hypothetical protein